MGLANHHLKQPQAVESIVKFSKVAALHLIPRATAILLLWR